MQEFWKKALNEIELEVSKPNFLTWFKNSALLEKENGVATVGLPNNFAKEWVEKKYDKIILRVLRNLDQTTKKIKYVVYNPAKYNQKINQLHQDTEQLTFKEFRVDPESNLNPRYTLKSFIVGKSNEFAYSACEAVINNIGIKYNPLFIYGGVGVGKTHLIQALGNEIKQRYKDEVKVKYVPSEKFINEVIQGIRNKRMDGIKAKYRNVDVLIIDDIQFISGKTSTEIEFFHTFNALYENNKQIVISSDRPPSFISALTERLQSRFEGGMTADISPPDYELKIAVLKSKLAELNTDLPDDVLEVIATSAQKSFRELEGILNRVLFYIKTKNEDLDAKKVAKLINDITQKPSHNITVNKIIKGVADFFEISPQEITGRCRKKEVAEPRQIAMYLLREIMNLSYPFIGEKLGKRDHTTVIYACEKVGQEINRNHKFNQTILAIKELIYNN